MYFKTAEVAGFSVVYREAGDPSKPTIVMLHGFPSSSHPFHGLFPLLSGRFTSLRLTTPAWGSARRRNQCEVF